LSIAVSFEDLTFTYRATEKPALENIRGHLEEGQWVALMGQSGAGKSTLCCCLNGLVPRFFRGDYQGRVMVKGQEVARRTVAEMSRTVGIVFQDFEAQLFSTNVELEMAFGPENQNLPRAEIGRRIERYLRLVGLENLRRREPATLSGGQKQRLAIGSVLALEPEILVLDEPTTDLDPRGREEVLALAANLRKGGRTILVVDHEPETAIDADAVWLLREGRVVAEGAPSTILTDLPLLESCGIKPPPPLELFQSLGWPGKPLTPDAAVELMKREGLKGREGAPSSSQPVHPDTRDVVLKTEGLRYAYPSYPVEALRGIDLSIRRGEFVAILGQNGSGKTTLAKHFNGLLRPTSGTVWLEGKPTPAYTHGDMARRVGYVFQNPDHQIFARTVHDEVGFGLKMLGASPKIISDRVAEALSVVELRGYEQKVPFALTKGERQRVAVASVLAVQPHVLILDEPTTGLDYGQQRRTMEMLKRLNGQGHTIIIITHSMWVAAEYAERTIAIKDGQVLLDGPTRLVFQEEGLLAEASLRIPSLVQLSNRLGCRSLTLRGLTEELRERAR